MTREDQEQIAANVRAGIAAVNHALRIAAEAGVRVDLDIRPVEKAGQDTGQMKMEVRTWPPT